MRRILPVLAVLAFAACSPPSLAPTPRSGTTVHASFATAWTAAVDVFAERNIPILTIDRASGLIVGETVRASGQPSYTANEFADCGKDFMREYLHPNSMAYNVRIRGDSTSATAQLTARFVSPQGNECTTRGVVESLIETRIKEKAEAGGPR